MYPCAGARDAAEEDRLRAAFDGGGGAGVRSLRREPHEREATCWLHWDEHCLSTLEPGEAGRAGPA